LLTETEGELENLLVADIDGLEFVTGAEPVLA
jgi:hypothetical protein